MDKKWMEFPGVVFLLTLLLIGWPFLTGPAVVVVAPLWYVFLLVLFIRKVIRARK